MNNTKKIIALAVLAAMPVIANAGFMAYYPLEQMKGGSLPNGSINIGNGSGNPTDPTGPTEPSNKCEYDSETKLIGLKIDSPPFLAGDVIIMYAGRFIGAQSPSNGLLVPAGITNGEVKSNTSNSMDAEVCGSNLDSYPTLPFPTGTPPVDDNAITFTDTITSNSCPEARAEHNVTCSLDGAHVSQTMDLQLDDSYGIIIYTDFLSPEDRAKLSTATTISTNTGKSCLIDKIYENGVSCYNKTLILENETGSTITFTIK